MTTNLKAIVSEPLGAYHVGTVIDKVGYLLNSIEAPQLSKLIEELIFYVANPHNAAELDKERFACLTNSSLSLLSMLTDLRAMHEDYVAHVRERGL